MTKAQQQLRELRERQSRERQRMAELSREENLTDETRADLDKIESGTRGRTSCRYILLPSTRVPKVSIPSTLYSDVSMQRAYVDMLGCSKRMDR